jgi:hypothetical protein
METHELIEALNRMSKTAHKKCDKATGKRGGTNAQSNFYLGAYAVIDNIIFAIENDDMKTLEMWAKE